ncbi:hypothetical protein BV20DRAFT_551109 [Pilatotrama ljubarskyi]|nr:hypothetical protein BV20DRAFT_551109 [Pilatotrama ljubarskyi]
MALRRPLPLELFLAIKSCIPVSDIRPHVCFYKAHPRIAALYDSEEDADELWRRVCWHSGIGALEEDDLEAEHCWRDIALEVIDRDGFCTHPQCGQGLLEYNAQRIARAQNYIRPLTVFSDWKEDDSSDVDSFMSVDSENEEEKNPPVNMHRVLLRTAFRTSSSGGYGMCDDAQLRPLTDTERAYKGRVLLSDHPLIERSFATDVPTSIVILGEIARYEFHDAGILQRDTGITVSDVMQIIWQQLDEPFIEYERKYIARELWDRGLPDGWTEEDAYQRFECLRDVLAVCRITEFYYDGTVVDGGPLFCINLRGD